MTTPRTLLVTVVGRDRPGITAQLFDSLSGEVLDVEQVLVRGRLLQAVLVELGPADDATVVTARITEAAARLGLEIDVVQGGAEAATHRSHRHLVTVLAQPLRPHVVAGISRRVAAAGGNIEIIRRTAKYPITAVAMEVTGADPGQLRTGMAEEAAACAVDVAVQRLDLEWRGQRLVVMDVDSTLIQDEVIELIAAHAGCEDEVARVTEAAMAGEIDFEESLRQRTALLAGLPAEALDEVRQQVRLTPGARTLCRTLRRMGDRIALVSGGFAEVVLPLAAELGVDYVRANRLEVADGRLTGRLTGPVVDRPGKAAALREFAADAGIPLSRTVAIGDGANDLDMLATAGLGVAFNAKPIVRAEADTAVSVPYLDSVLYLLGVSREEIEAADAAEPADTAGSIG